MSLTPALQEFYERFFVLSEDFTSGALRVRAVDDLGDPAGLTRGEWAPDRAVRFERDDGKRPVDFVGTTWATLSLVSDRFVGSLRRRGLTGWTTYPVEINGVPVEEPVGYHGLVVKGRCGAIDDQLSPQVLLPPPVPQGRASTGRRGLLFEYGSWDGSDLFCSITGTSIFATVPVVDALREDAITNVCIRRALDVERTWNADGSLLP